MNGVAVLIPIVGMLIPIILVPIVLGIRHARLERELEHAERMRALELGRQLPGDEGWTSPPRICLAIGAGVPVCVVACAAVATIVTGFQDGIWVSSMSVAMTAVISGTVLAFKHFIQRHESESRSMHASADKPHMDADAFDVVGSRG